MYIKFFFKEYEKNSLNEEKCSIKCGLINNIDYRKCPDGQYCSEIGYCGITSGFYLVDKVKENMVNVKK